MDLNNQFGIQLIQFTNVSWNHTDNTKYFKHYLESSLIFRPNQVAVFFFENLNFYFMKTVSFEILIIKIPDRMLFVQK